MSPAERPGEPAPGKANILVVDDLPEKLLVFQTILEELGQNLVMAHSGSEALQQVLQHEFAVILLDVNMPDIDGIETATLMRRYRKSAHTPIIFITAHADEMQTAQGYQLGAVDYILSPIVPDVLRSKVRVFVDLFQLRERTRLMAEERIALARAEAARSAAEEANRRKDEFLAMLSHELRNPLAPIRTAVEVMRRIAAPEPALALARDVVERQVAHLVRLVDQLLDVSRISEGKILLKKEPVELAQVIKHGIETERSLIELRGQSLVVNLPATPVRLFGDFARLAQVLSNLLNNAAKYTQEGGRIELSATADEGEAVVRVKDNGSGIEPRLLPRVFELFVQGERSLDRSQGGLGVGLTLVQRIVELHEGRVEVSSEGAGLGTEVKVVLPCVSAVHPQEPPVRLAAVPRLRGRRVLVADDNADAAESIGVYLGLEGHVVKTVLDGESALAAARLFLPQVAVLDLGLPAVDGYELARRLRQHEETRDALLIAVTGYGQTEDRERARSAGFDGYFVKPADPREILAAIDRGRARRESGRIAS